MDAGSAGDGSIWRPGHVARHHRHPGPGVLQLSHHAVHLRAILSDAAGTAFLDGLLFIDAARGKKHMPNTGLLE